MYSFIGFPAPSELYLDETGNEDTDWFQLRIFMNIARISESSNLVAANTDGTIRCS